jgi:YidC/Oxa1 family membrane protein insertase
MNFDRNTLLGFIFLGVLFLGFFYYNSKQQEAYQIQKAKDDSIALAAKPKVNPRKDDFALIDAFQKASIGGDFQSFGDGTEQLTIVENEVLRVAFTNKGGQPKWVEMKKFKGPDSTLARLGASGSDGFDYPIKTEENKPPIFRNCILP